MTKLTELEELKMVVGNQLRAELPEVVPGLTKLAYEQIVEETLEKIAATAWEREIGAGITGIDSALWRKIKEESLVNAGKVGAGVGILAAAGATMVGFNKATDAVKKHALHPAFLQALQSALNSSDKAGEILRGADHAKVLSYGETIFNYAPNVATDTNLLKGILANAVDYGSIDPATIRSLMELEEKRKNLHAWKPTDILAKG